MGIEEEERDERKQLREHIERLLVNSVPECAVLAYQVELERTKTANNTVQEERNKLQFMLAVIQTVCATVFAITCVVSATHVVSGGSSRAGGGKDESLPQDCWILKPPQQFSCEVANNGGGE